MWRKFLYFYHTQDTITFWLVSICSFAALFLLILLFINLPSLPPQLPLFYSQPWGEKQLATIPQFLVLPSVVVLITLINLMISWHLHSSQIVLKRMLAISSVVIALLFVITAFKIVYIFA